MYWDELQSHCPIGACICGSKCKATKSIIAAQEREFILYFLMGLDDKFSHARGHILLSDPIPSINKVFSLIIQEEEQLRNNSILESATILLKNETGCNSEGGGKTNHKPLCTHCGKSDDTIEKCYHLHGFPPRFKFATRRNASNLPGFNSVHNVSIEQEASQAPKLSTLQEQCQHLITSLQNQTFMSSNQPFVNHVSVPLGQSINLSLVSNFSSNIAAFSNTSNSHHCASSQSTQCQSWIIDTRATNHTVRFIDL